MKSLDFFIDGDWVASNGEGNGAREVLSPVDGELLAHAPQTGSEQLDLAVQAARAAQPGWASSSAWERARICHAIADRLDLERDRLARSLCAEQGKPYLSEALEEVSETATNFRVAAEDIKRLESSIVPAEDASKRVLTFRRANGVYAAITPWNYPMLIPAELIAPGIAAGNAIVIKPSEWTPVTMANLMRVMAEAGLPDGVVNVIYGDGEVGHALVTHPGIDCIGFVGSAGTAERIVRAAGLKRSLIEASGNGPVIVCGDADLRQAAKGAVFGGFYCAGQVCCASERVLVNASVHDDFLTAVVEEARRWRLGDPFDERTLVGPLNNPPTASKMERHVADAVDQGAEVVLGGSRDRDRPTELYFQPTVIDRVGAETLINREETFGPIVPITTVPDDDAAITMANASDLGLRAAVYTDSIRRAFQLIDGLRVGNVVVNDSTNYGEAHLPFGGATGTRSGWGRIGGRYTLLDMTQIQTAAIHID